jgi:2-haloacid dehalogenase
MGPPRAINALVFDAYGTLFELHSLSALCEQLFPGQGAALSQLWRAKQVEYAWLLTLTGRYEDFWYVTGSALDFACRMLRLPCEPAMRTRLLEAYLHRKPYPEVVPALKALSRYTPAILSNGSPRMLQEVVANAGLQGMLSHVMSVDEAKVYKPSPYAYQLAPQKMGLNKSAIGFVSGNSWDVLGARACGFWTCWVNRDDSPGEVLGLSPDLIVRSLTELADSVG